MFHITENGQMIVLKNVGLTTLDTKKQKYPDPNSDFNSLLTQKHLNMEYAKMVHFVVQQLFNLSTSDLRKIFNLSKIIPFPK